TPFRAATKAYIGNAARDASAAVGFAQLITAGANHGVHAFFVPVRDDAGDPLPGITIEDDGYQGGLKGVDNGRLAFDSVRVARTNLLNRYGDVAAAGTYSAHTESPRRHFCAIIVTRVRGRLSLAVAPAVPGKRPLDIALRYGLRRKQCTTGADSTETTLLDYGQHQRRLMPDLA